jgi:hypothetical protein
MMERMRAPVRRALRETKFAFIPSVLTGGVEAMSALKNEGLRSKQVERTRKKGGRNNTIYDIRRIFTARRVGRKSSTWPGVEIRSGSAFGGRRLLFSGERY